MNTQTVCNDNNLWHEWSKNGLTVRWYEIPDTQHTLCIVVSYRDDEMDERTLHIGDTLTFSFNRSLVIAGSVRLTECLNTTVELSICANITHYNEQIEQLHEWNIINGQSCSDMTELADHWKAKWRVFGEAGAVVNALVTLTHGAEPYHSETLSPNESLVWKTNCAAPKSFLECGATLTIDHKNVAKLVASTPSATVLVLDEILTHWPGAECPALPEKPDNKMVIIGNQRPAQYFSSFTFPGAIETPDSKQVERRFFNIDNLTDFQIELINARTASSGTRDKMTLLANQYLKGEPPYTGQYVANISSLPVPYNTLVEPNISVFLNQQYTSITAMELAFKHLTGVHPSEFCTDKNYLTTLSRLQNSAIAWLVSGIRNGRHIDALLLSLMVFNLADSVTTEEKLSWTEDAIADLLEANAVLSDSIFPIPLPEAEAGKKNAIGQNPTAVKILGISDVMTLRQQLLEYCEGELAHVENVMKSEFRERVYENKHEDRLISETADDSLSSTRTDYRLDGSSKIEPLMAVERVFNDLSNAYNSDGLSSAITGGWFDSPGRVDTSNSTFTPTDSAESFARHILDKSVNLSDKKIRSARSTLSHSMFRIKNTRSFDNREGTEHISGKYRWVNERYAIFLEKKDARLLLEFSLPNPAKKLIEREQQFKGTNFVLAVPPWEDEIIEGTTIEGVQSASDITRDNYQPLTQRYQGKILPAPPNANLTYNVAFQGAPPFDRSNITIADGYRANSIVVSYIANKGETATAKLLIGPELITAEANNTSTSTDISSSQLAGNIAVSLLCEAEQYAVVVTVTAVCLEDSQVFVNWQNETYHAILAAYNVSRQAYIQSFDTIFLALDKKNKTDTLGHYQRCLKRQCIEQLIDLFKTQWAVGNDESWKNDVINFNLIPFFERAISWNEMITEFNPENYSDETNERPDWLKMIQLEPGSDREEFLVAASARVMVSVKYDYVLPMMFYILSAGRFWFGHNTLTPVYKKSIDLANRWKNANNALNSCGNLSTWNMELATTMMVLQGEHSLPCFPIDPTTAAANTTVSCIQNCIASE